MFLLVPYHHYTPRNKVGGGGVYWTISVSACALPSLYPHKQSWGGVYWTISVSACALLSLYPHKQSWGRVYCTISVSACALPSLYPHKQSCGGLLDHQCFCLCLTIIILPQTKLGRVTGPSVFLLVPYHHYTPTNEVWRGVYWTISVSVCGLPSL